MKAISNEKTGDEETNKGKQTRLINKGNDQIKRRRKQIEKPDKKKQIEEQIKETDKETDGRNRV